MSLDLSLEASPVRGPAPLDVTVTATVAEDPGGLAYVFDWGDDTPAQGGPQNARTHAYATPGRYAVLVTVTDIGGDTGVKAIAVEAERPLPAGVNPIEVAAQRNLTTAYIEAESTDVVLSRVALVSNNAGGFRHGVASPLPPQTVRLIDQAAERQRNLLDGETVRVTFVMMGEWDMDVMEGDWFFMDGIKYEVVGVEEKRLYKTMAEVYRRG